ncbi:MAG: outer membrane beta-barrel domain-containing protein [Hahellaceae bacterium]|nr:outer membrane beta-barrel domain-containing protein [Hahellaceae bacterium]
MQHTTKLRRLQFWLKACGLIACCFLSGAVIGAEPDTDADKTVFDPDVTPRKVQVDNLDSENFELGVYVGILSIEDFESSLLYGFNARYHFSEDFFAEVNVASTEAGESSYERLSGDVSLLPDDDRKLLAYDLTFGFNLFPGQAFVARSLVFNSRFFLLGGLGSTDFAGDSRLTLNFGFGYQVYPTDWWAFQVTARDHIFDIDVVGTDKTTHNIELSTGVSVFF